MTGDSGGCARPPESRRYPRQPQVEGATPLTAASAPQQPAFCDGWQQVVCSPLEQYGMFSTDELVHAADVVITLGCGGACPITPGRRYLDWPVPTRRDDPSPRSSGSATNSTCSSPT